jgi:hypothetical protein
MLRLVIRPVDSSQILTYAAARELNGIQIATGPATYAYGEEGYCTAVSPLGQGATSYRPHQVGRLVSRTGAASPHSCASDSPVNAVDPSGLFCLEFWSPSQCSNALTTFLQSSQTVGVCANGSGQFGLGFSLDLCGIVHFTGGAPVGLGTTATVGGGGGYGVGSFGSLGSQLSNARRISDLGRQFAHTTVSAGLGLSFTATAAVGLSSCGQTIGVVTAGIGPGGGLSYSTGVSWTWTQTWVGS